MKSLLDIAAVILFAVALMELYRDNMELKYNYEALAWDVKNKNEQLDETISTLFQRTRQNAQKTNGTKQASLELVPGREPIEVLVVEKK